LLGACHRAANVGEDSTVEGDYVIAFENGICPRGDQFADLAYAVVVAPSGRVTVRCSREVVVPSELVEQSRATGWAVTAGKLEASRTPGCDHADPHVVWSRGAETRLGILADLAQEVLQAALRAEGVIS
jgi:hypothetical protein